MTDTLTIIRPDDWHLHLRDGDALTDVVGDTAHQFDRAIIMSNLRPPMTTTTQVRTCHERILTALPAGTQFEPLMTLYLTDNIPPEIIREARVSGFIHGMKLHPADATTNNDAGVTDLCCCIKTLEAMQEASMSLLMHGEVTDLTIDIFDRGVVFVDTVMLLLRRDFPAFKVMFEHITTEHTAGYVCDTEDLVGATITVYHLLYNRNALFAGDIRLYYYCLPVLKRGTHRPAPAAATTSGHPRFFLGTDNTPHARGVRKHACGCASCYTTLHAMELHAKAFEDTSAFSKPKGLASLHGSGLYDLPRNADTLTFIHSQWQFSAEAPSGEQTLMPSCGGEMLRWKFV